MGALMSLLAKARAIIAELPVAEVRLASFQHVCSVDIAENAARLEYEEGLTRDEADRRALGARGYSSWPALADTHPERTRRQLGRLPPPSSEHGHRLLGLTCEFLDTPHWQAAVALGWSLIELFGINPHAPLVRIDSQGLVIGLALSKLNCGRLEIIAEGHATIRYRSGSQLVWRRGASGLDAAVLWWECDALVGVDGPESADGAAVGETGR